MSGHPDLHAILVGDGDVPAPAALDAAWPGWDAGAALLVAADGGATKALAAGLAPDLVVGDADSLGPAGLAAVRAAGIPVELAAVAKDESDLELAVLAALARGATRLTILGAMGGPRFDHAMANVWLLAHAALAGRTAVLLGASARVRLLDATSAPASVVLAGDPGDLVSLFPFGADAGGVATDGLAYPLRDEPLGFGPARGLSNVRSGPEARVSLRVGRLLIIETRCPEGRTR
ncbi:MAG TPA: thiamine diphosphokinase [Candidatus Nanopelagicales bacterium]|nr:thiamine diphosphokinase [Candidatus Nanopelagicales bacterium]